MHLDSRYAYKLQVCECCDSAVVGSKDGPVVTVLASQLHVLYVAWDQFCPVAVWVECFVGSCLPELSLPSSFSEDFYPGSLFFFLHM